MADSNCSVCKEETIPSATLTASHSQAIPTARNNLSIPIKTNLFPRRRGIHHKIDNNETVSCEDDIRCAAFALTSLSLSPAAGTLSPTGFPRNATDIENKFIFPTVTTKLENNEDDEDNDDKSDEFPFYPVTCGKCNRGNDATSIKGTRPNKDNSFESTGSVKPRSYSHRDYFTARKTVHEFSKPRSSSFDAVGRACKPYNVLHSDVKSTGVETCTAASQSKLVRCRLSSSPRDDGLGSSSGSTDSVDHNPTKRKVASSRLFRCMWRGCDKETISLNGIIMHVRHAHIGPSQAGEEEFYFDDVNINSNTTSGISSSEESLHDDQSKHRYTSSPLSISSAVRSQQFADLTVNQQNKSTQQISDQARKTERDTRTSFDIPTLATSSRNTKKIRPQMYTPTNVVNNFTVTTQLQRECQAILPRHLSVSYAVPWSGFGDGAHASFFEKSSDLAREITLNISKDSLDLKTGSNKHRQNFFAYHCDKEHFHSSLPKAGNTLCQALNEQSAPREKIQSSRRKGRKKCRKVYGMNNKHLWCTQCRWKKACVRFK